MTALLYFTANLKSYSRNNDSSKIERKWGNMNAMMNLHRSFGLQGLSAYIPKEPVEIIDGNSKVQLTNFLII